MAGLVTIHKLNIFYVLQMSKLYKKENTVVFMKENTVVFMKENTVVFTKKKIKTTVFNHLDGDPVVRVWN
jgi:hypothetical protein